MARNQAKQAVLHLCANDGNAARLEAQPRRIAAWRKARDRNRQLAPRGWQLDRENAASAGTAKGIGGNRARGGSSPSRRSL